MQLQKDVLSPTFHPAYTGNTQNCSIERNMITSCDFFQRRLSYNPVNPGYLRRKSYNLGLPTYHNSKNRPTANLQSAKLYYTDSCQQDYINMWYKTDIPVSS